MNFTITPAAQKFMRMMIRVDGSTGAITGAATGVISSVGAVSATGAAGVAAADVAAAGRARCAVRSVRAGAGVAAGSAALGASVSTGAISSGTRITGFGAVGCAVCGVAVGAVVLGSGTVGGVCGVARSEGRGVRSGPGRGGSGGCGAGRARAGPAFSTAAERRDAPAGPGGDRAGSHPRSVSHYAGGISVGVENRELPGLVLRGDTPEGASPFSRGGNRRGSGRRGGRSAGRGRGDSRSPPPASRSSVADSDRNGPSVTPPRGAASRAERRGGGRRLTSDAPVRR